jgi:cytoskeletal protein RodZ
MEKRVETNSDLEPRARFGSFLRSHRTKSDLSLDDIARITKIPRISLERLEDGRFEELPGDVFVRGFLRSYARCVGLDGEEAVRAYARCGLQPAPVSSSLADIDEDGLSEVPPADAVEAAPEPKRVTRILKDAFELAKRRREGSQSSNDSEQPSRDSEQAAESEAVPRAITAQGSDRIQTREAIAPQRSTAPARARTFLPPVLGEDEGASRRGPLTLAVIILVIVATLTMSYLLRRPSSGGTAYTAAETSAEMAQS